MNQNSLMVFNVTVDLSNKAQVDAFNKFTTEMHMAMSEKDSEIEGTKEETPSDKQNSPEPVTRKRNRTKKEVQKEEPGETQEVVEEKENPENSPAPAESKVIKVEEVRALLAEKVDDHRKEIKAKLTELGAPNVSALDPGKYAEFVEFLNTL